MPSMVYWASYVSRILNHMWSVVVTLERSTVEQNLCECAVTVARTWSGPAWSPALSLSSLLMSIQSLMNEKPYHNEPGFEQVGHSVQVGHCVIMLSCNLVVSANWPKCLRLHVISYRHS